MKLCKCGIRDWNWCLDSSLRSWIKCKACGGSMFGEGVGVILINWNHTSLDGWDLGDVLEANKSGGVVGE